MNKNIIIVALAALLVGIGIGFTMAQVNRADMQQPVASQQAASAEVSSGAQASEQASAQTGEQASEQPSAQTSTQTGDAEGAEAQSSATQDLSQEPAAQGSQSQGSQNASSAKEDSASPTPQNAGVQVEEDGTYTSKDEVAAYIHTYGHLPSNFVSKTKAKKAGWVANKGNLDDVLPGMSIGGSEFYNDEGLLPDAPGRTWTECDINYEGGYRGAERIVFSNDGLIFYTGDHYKTFEQLY